MVSTGDAQTWLKRYGLNAVLIVLIVAIGADILQGQQASLRSGQSDPSPVPGPGQESGLSASGDPRDQSSVPGPSPAAGPQSTGVPPPQPVQPPGGAQPQANSEQQQPPQPEQPQQPPPQPQQPPEQPPQPEQPHQPSPVERFRGHESEVPPPEKAPPPDVVYRQFVDAMDSFVRVLDGKMHFAVTRCEKPPIKRVEPLSDKEVGNECEPWFTRGVVHTVGTLLRPTSSKVLVYGDETGIAWWLARGHTVTHLVGSTERVRDELIPNIVSKLPDEVKARYTAYALPPTDLSAESMPLYRGYHVDSSRTNLDFTRMCRGTDALTDADKHSFDVVAMNSRARMGALWEAVHTWAKPKGALIVLNNSGRKRYTDVYPKFMPAHWLAAHDPRPKDAAKMTSMWLTCTADDAECAKAKEALKRVTKPHPELLDPARQHKSWPATPGDKPWKVDVEELYQKTGAKKPA